MHTIQIQSRQGDESVQGFAAFVERKVFYIMDVGDIHVFESSDEVRGRYRSSLVSELAFQKPVHQQSRVADQEMGFYSKWIAVIYGSAPEVGLHDTETILDQVAFS